jgi:hypothetical protein
MYRSKKSAEKVLAAVFQAFTDNADPFNPMTHEICDFPMEATKELE